MADHKTVLVVEDDQALSYFIAQTIRKLGHTVHVAFDGEEAIKLVSQYSPHLILLDVLIPRINGWDVLKFIRQHESKTVPVVIMSNLDEAVGEQKIKNKGANEYVMKVLMSKKELADIVAKHL